MGWSSAGQRIFDPVAQALVDGEAPDEVVTPCLVRLIKELQQEDWDTEHDSLGRFSAHPAVVAAFAEHGIT